MADLGIIGFGTRLSGTGLKFGLDYTNLGFGTILGGAINTRSSIPINVSCNTLGLSSSNFKYPTILPPNGGIRTFILKVGPGGATVVGAKVTISEHHSQEKLYTGFRLSDANGMITFRNLNTNSFYTVVAVHPTLNSYNAARFDWVVPNSS